MKHIFTRGCFSPATLLALIVIIAGACSTQLHAEILDITAEFRPSAANPSLDKFTNTTPSQGYCDRYQPYCGDDVASLVTNLTIKNKTFVGGSTNNNERTYQSLDAGWKTITLTDSNTNQSITVQFRLMLLAQRFTRNAGGLVMANFRTAGSAPEGRCAGTVGAGDTVNHTYYRFAWKHNSEPPFCFRSVQNMSFTDVDVEEISVGYEMVSSSPMNMPNGTFNGEIEYTVGQGQQIDLGSGVYSDNRLTIKIVAEIEHELRFEQTGNPKVNMLPPGGWGDWTSGGASQFRLEGGGTFKSTASAPFSVYLECEHMVLNNCALQMEGTNTLIQVNTTITIPGVWERGSKIVITNWPLYVRSPVTPDYVLEPMWYVNAVDSTVKFSVNEVESLRMGQFPGSTWKGSASLIFDADIP